MGIEKTKRAVYNDGEASVCETKTLSGASAAAAATLLNRGTTFIVSTGTGAGWSVNLPRPLRAGIRKTIFFDANSTVPIEVRTASSVDTFFGSTANALACTTGLVTPKRAILIGKSTSQWAVLHLSTGVTVAGATA